jgi:hypothetical protein
MKRVATLERDTVRDQSPDVLWLDIGECVDPSEITMFEAQDEDVQKRLKGIRTDLDRFTRDEIRALIRHGYEIGLNRISSDPTLSSILKAPLTQIVDPCIEGWPDRPRHMEYARKMAQLDAAYERLIKKPLQELLDALDVEQTLREEIARELAIRLGRSPSIEEIRKAVAAKRAKEDEEAQRPAIEKRRQEVQRLRQSLEKSQRRALGLWDWDDWSSWLLLLLLCTLCYGLAFLLMRMSIELPTQRVGIYQRLATHCRYEIPARSSPG